MLSIIVPTLNEANYLPLLLDSLQKQSFKDFEVIIADAGSTDTTLNIAKQNKCQLIEGGLPAKGRNEGAKIARGEHLLFLDADVILPERHFLKKSLEEIGARQLDIATCKIIPLGQKKINKLMFNFYEKYIRLVRPLFVHTVGACIFVKRDLHVKIQGFDETMLLAEDHDYGNRAAQEGCFGFIKSTHIRTSMRRFETDGHLRVGVKYLACELMLLSGEKEWCNFFKYRFNHYKNGPREKKIKAMLRRLKAKLENKTLSR